MLMCAAVCGVLISLCCCVLDKGRARGGAVGRRAGARAEETAEEAVVEETLAEAEAAGVRLAGEGLVGFCWAEESVAAPPKICGSAAWCELDEGVSVIRCVCSLREPCPLHVTDSDQVHVPEEEAQPRMPRMPRGLDLTSVARG